MNTNTDGVSAMSAELGGDMPGDDDGDLQTRYDMLKSWLVEADASNDRLKKHLHNVLEIAHTWQPDYATKMDRDTLALAAQAIAYEPPNAEAEAKPSDVSSDMLEALEHIMRCIPMGGFAQIHHGSSTWEQIDAAVSKARGELPNTEGKRPAQGTDAGPV
jgi:hypothetical protein